MRTKVACDKKDFIVTARLEAYERGEQGEKQVFARDFSERIRRNGN